MKQEEKELLIKDLCGRLPYRTLISIGEDGNKYRMEEIRNALIGIDTFKITIDGYDIEHIKPYLFPLSSMTKIQEDEWYEIFINPLSKRLEDKHTRQEDLQLKADAQAFGIEYLLKNYFDIYDLIPLGLTIDCTNLNIY